MLYFLFSLTAAPPSPPLAAVEQVSKTVEYLSIVSSDLAADDMSWEVFFPLLLERCTDRGKKSNLTALEG